MIKVSIIVTCYNKEKYIYETINSVLKQTYSDFELIIVDDGSTDNSIEIIKKINDKRIIVISQDNNGVNSARNKGISIATGSLVAFLDGDDIWLSSKLQEQIDLIITNNLDMCFCDYFTINQVGKRCNDYYKLEFPNFSYNKLRNKILTGNYVLGSASSVLVRKIIIDAIGELNVNLKWGEDWEYWLRIIYFTKKIGFLQKKLIEIRFGINQVQSTLNHEKRFNDTIYILNNLIKNYKLSRKETSLVYLNICKTIYNFNGSFLGMLKNYLMSIHNDFFSIIRIDIHYLIFKFSIKKFSKWIQN
jgi:glycosyltransferase involved in cell wall biosynthesis